MCEGSREAAASGELSPLAIGIQASEIDRAKGSGFAKLVPVPGGPVIRALAVLSWLRDIGIVLLFLAGNQIRHGAFGVGLVIQMCAVVMFLERLLWHWQLSMLREARVPAERTRR